MNTTGIYNLIGLLVIRAIVKSRMENGKVYKLNLNSLSYLKSSYRELDASTERANGPDTVPSVNPRELFVVN